MYRGYSPSDVYVGAQFTIAARVQDAYGSDTRTVTINVVAAEPVNHPPVFGQSAYQWSVLTTAAAGDVVGTISAGWLGSDCRNRVLNSSAV